MIERLVQDYLAAVAQACAGLPASARMELMADLREHIAVARAELPEQSEEAVAAILQRLGEPATIAAEARAAVPAPLIRPVPPMPPMPMRRPTSTPTAAIVAAVVLVPVGIFALVLIVGFLAYYTRS